MDPYVHAARGDSGSQQQQPGPEGPSALTGIDQHKKSHHGVTGGERVPCWRIHFKNSQQRPVDVTGFVLENHRRPRPADGFLEVIIDGRGHHQEHRQAQQVPAQPAFPFRRQQKKGQQSDRPSAHRRQAFEHIIERTMLQGMIDKKKKPMIQRY